jgi:hypothetical protein
VRAAPTRLPLGLAAAALVYLALRGAVLAGRFDEICHPGYELTLVGNIARAASSGWHAPPLAGFFDNCGGHLAFGLLGAPLFALLGDSYLVLKLVPLLVGLGALACLWAILAPRAGRQAATLACLVFALGPPLLTRLSVTAMGNHFESLLPLFACQLAWLRWCESDGRRRHAVAFGLVAGLSLFVYLGSALWLALLVPAHLRLRGVRASARDALHAAPGLVLGLAPLAWILRAAPGRLEGFFSFNLGEAATRVLPTAGLYPDAGPLPGRAAELCLLAVLALAWITLARAAARDARLLPLVLYPPTLLAAFAISRFDFEPLTSLEAAATRRYLVPCLGLSILGLGFAFGEWSRRGRRALAGGALALVLATVPSALTLALPSQRPSPSGAEFRGWSSHYLARVLLRDVQRRDPDGRPRWDFARVAAGLDPLREEERGDVAFGLGHYVSWSDADDPLAAVSELARALPPALADEAHEGVGAFLRERCRAGALAAEALGDYLAQVACEHPGPARAVARGLARGFGPHLGNAGRTPFAWACDLGREVPEALRADWGEGLARARARLERCGPGLELRAARAALAGLAPPLRACVGDPVRLP